MTDFDELEQTLRRYRPVGPPASMRPPAVLRSPGRPSRAPLTTGRAVTAAVAAAATVALATAVWRFGMSAGETGSTASEVSADAPVETSAAPRGFEPAWTERPRVDFGVPANGAAVVMLEFVDWLCPGRPCDSFAGQGVADRYAVSAPGTVRHIVADFPINTDCNPAVSRTVPGHEASCVAAAAVRLARLHDRERDLIQWLMQRRGGFRSLDPPDVVAAIKTETARLLGAAPSETDYADQVALVRREAGLAAALGVTSVPALYINGRAASDGRGPWNADDVARAVDLELAAAGSRAGGQSPQAPVRVGGDIAAVPRTRTVIPAYPEDPSRGIVAILELTVEPTGRVNSVNVLRASQGAAITDAALAAVRQWEYEPLELAGEPVWFVQTVVIHFPWPM
jgi:TonB family protein